MSINIISESDFARLDTNQDNPMWKAGSIIRVQ